MDLREEGGDECRGRVGGELEEIVEQQIFVLVHHSCYSISCSTSRRRRGGREREEEEERVGGDTLHHQHSVPQQSDRQIGEGF